MFPVWPLGAISHNPSFSLNDISVQGNLIGMSHRKWREIKQQPSRARQGHQISCCRVALHFLCDILSGRPGCTQFAHKHHRQLLKTAPQSLYGAIPIRVMGSVYMPRGEGPHLKMRNISRSVILVLCLIHNRHTRGYCLYRDGQKC